MPFADISIARGKSREYRLGIYEAVHEALVTELGMPPQDRFGLIHQFDREDMIFEPQFRGGPRSDDWMLIRITDGRDRGETRKRRFYKKLVRLLGERLGVRDADVFVIYYFTEIENYSFGHGVIGTETAAREALDRASKVPGKRDAYTKEEMVEALTAFFGDNDRSTLVSMLPETFVMNFPMSMPYGGAYKGPKEFDNFVERVVESAKYYEHFSSELERIIESDDQLIVQNRIRAKGKTTGVSMDVHNAWVFDIANGNFVSAQGYPDSGAGAKTAG